MSLSNPNKSVTEERLAEFYQQILPYLGGMPEAIVNKFSKSDLYSTTEKVVGCWTDGKPVYQKTIVDTMPTIITDGTEVSKEISIGATIDTIVDSDVFIKNTTGTTVKATTFVANPNNHFRYTIINNTDSTSSRRNKVYVLGSYVSWSEKPLYITIQYTKTTDAANSFKWGDENDYSTNEKIVGTWIDGSYVYQKTIDYGTLPNTPTAPVGKAHNISNIDTIVNIKGIGVGVTNPHASIPLGCATIGNSGVMNHYVYLRANANNVFAYTTEDLSDWHAYVTLQYTKTTD